MLIITASFISSFLINMYLVRYKKVHQHFTGDCELDGPQKIHKSNIPRIGGFGIYIALLLASALSFYLEFSYSKIFFLMLLSAFIVFMVGILEDITKRVGVKIRLFSAVISSICYIYFFDISFINVDVFFIDYLLSNKWITYIFIIFCCSGLSNAFNIIDGLNGLSSMVAIIALVSIGIISNIVNDNEIFYICMISLASIFGFFIWNYPHGRIFLGDGGAYLIGFLIAVISILLTLRNPIISPWFFLLVNIYPIFETIFTIWRRFFLKGVSPSTPDGLHLHSLIYKRKIRILSEKSKIFDTETLKNSLSSPFLWFISLLGAIPSVVFWQSTPLLIVNFLFYVIIYIYIYKLVIKFKPF